ncbi:MAG: alpha/beta fold hydrolase [Acidimicrobiia bacterium]
MSLARPPGKGRASAGSLFVRFLGFLLFLALVGALVWALSVTAGVDSFEILDAADTRPGSLVTLTNGEVVHYQEVGSGPPVVLIHDFDIAGGYQWLEVAAALPNYRLIIPDQTDFGFGQRPSGPGRQHTIAGRAESAALLIDELELGQPSVVGAGMGGAIAAQLAVDDPDLVDHLVLIAPEIYGPRPTWTEFFFRVPVIGPALTFTNLGGGNRAVSEYQAECAIGGWCPTVADLDARQAAAMIRGTTASIVAMTATPRASTIPADLPEIESPTLVIWGENDQMTPAGDGQEVADAVPGSSLVVLPGIGHRPHLQDPVATAALIAGFLES